MEHVDINTYIIFIKSANEDLLSMPEEAIGGKDISRGTEENPVLTQC